MRFWSVLMMVICGMKTWMSLKQRTLLDYSKEIGLEKKQEKKTIICSVFKEYILLCLLILSFIIHHSTTIIKILFTFPLWNEIISGILLRVSAHRAIVRQYLLTAISQTIKLYWIRTYTTVLWTFVIHLVHTYLILQVYRNCLCLKCA
jgi:hypothetical protein